MRQRSMIQAIVLAALLSITGVMQTNAQAFEYPESPEGFDNIAVKYQGSRPTISDFATAFLNYSKDMEPLGKEYTEFYGTINSEWQRYQQKKPLKNKASIIVDTKNGYMRYEIRRPEACDTTVMEMCFWNCADGKHKMVCANTVWRLDGDYGWAEYTGTHFFLYDNATKKMRCLLPEDIGALYDGDGLTVFFLPRKGKNIKVSAAGGGDRWDEVLEWDGYQFNQKEKP